MRISEKVLLLLSRKPKSNDHPVPSSNLNNALDLLCDAFPHILNKTLILDMPKEIELVTDELRTFDFSLYLK
jgi:hypothetical protein